MQLAALLLISDSSLW